jgi:hypothetical protein
MSLRPSDPAAGGHPLITWCETLAALAAAHRERRAAEDTSRWPLAHACSHRRGVANTGAADALVEARDADEAGPTRHAFCCRALA